ncbi:hypothetical protein IC619_010940 [Hazenella sp. IB182353]|uniref:CAP domain-containing protein n=1 Tax=Polycladospora coralii TaxID=2771432 RepID=UPI001746E956|nr:CAP domain-containing protein [Polycladospora coralii]MBS7531008.1 hypothetical protein [Polycladospora coralii]
MENKNLVLYSLFALIVLSACSNLSSSTVTQNEILEAEVGEEQPIDQSPEIVTIASEEIPEKESKDLEKTEKEAPKQEPVALEKASSKQEEELDLSKKEHSESKSEISKSQQYAESVLQIINIERDKVDLPPLKLSELLTKTARAKAEDMRDQNYYGHGSPVYGSLRDMLNTFGVPGVAAETNKIRQATPEAVTKGWINKPNGKGIYNKKWEYIGIGYAEGGSKGHYWTFMFISHDTWDGVTPKK